MLHITKLFGRYLLDHRKYILSYLVSILIFAVVFTLYSLPLVAVGYAALLAGSVSFLILIYSFIRTYKLHQALTDLRLQVVHSIEGLPPPETLLEKDYQMLLTAVSEAKAVMTSRSDSSRLEMINYYTLWVHQIKVPISAMRLLLQSDSLQEAPESVDDPIAEESTKKALSLELFKIEQYVEMVLQYIRLGDMSSDLR